MEHTAACGGFDHGDGAAKLERVLMATTVGSGKREKRLGCEGATGASGEVERLDFKLEVTQGHQHEVNNRSDGRTHVLTKAQ